MARYWLAVVQRSHVLDGVALGIVQTSHGAKGGIQRMSPGDGLVYYSPKTDYPEGETLREFTALGTIAAGDAWQEEFPETSFAGSVGAGVAGSLARSPQLHRAWRRAVEYDHSATPVPIKPLLEQLELTRGNSHWGMIMRRGQVELTEADYLLITREMHGAE